MKTPLLDLALYLALALAAGKLISKLAPEPQPTELPVRANETSVVKQSLTTPPPEPADTSPPPQVPALVWLDDQDRAIAASYYQPLLVVFTLPKDCVPCEQFKQQVLNQERTVIELSRFALFEVSGETAAAEWNVTSFPRCAIVRSGEVKDLWQPTADVEDFLTRLEANQ